ncbi:MAG TPA: hypothetical protein ENK24_02085, partial [Anaerolineae bacterium]|nr:hypothetical protein [Anaerolineae bacterium]
MKAEGGRMKKRSRSHAERGNETWERDFYLSALIFPPSSFRPHPSAFILPPSSFRPHPSALILPPSSFRLHLSALIL